MSLDVKIDDSKLGLIEVILDGRLDTETAPALEQKLADILWKPVRAVRFDMTRLNYVSSIGIRVMFSAFKTLKDRNTMFQMINLQPQIKKVFDIAQVLPVQNIFASVKEADEYFDVMQKRVLGEKTV